MRHVVVLVLILALWSGCGRSHSSSPTGPTTSNSTRDFGSNNPSVYSALGDSITLGVERIDGRTLITSSSYPAVLQDRLRATDAGARVINRGIGGETIEGGLARINGVLAVDHPGFILILEGTNSLGAMPLVADIREMVRRAKANKTVPLVATIPPSSGTSSSRTRSLARRTPRSSPWATRRGSRWSTSTTPSSIPDSSARMDFIPTTRATG